MVRVNRTANTALATMLAVSMSMPISSAYAQESHEEAAQAAASLLHADENADSPAEEDPENIPSSEETASNELEDPEEKVDIEATLIDSGEQSASPGPVEEQTPQAAAVTEGDIAIDEATFPDSAFRTWLLNPSSLGGIGSDGVLTLAEREAVKTLVAKRCGIVDLTGIEAFPNLIFIDVEGNYIEQVDLSGNPNLLSVYLRNNCLKSIDFSHNTKLEFIEIFDNQLSEVDLTMLPDLRFVHLDYNNLKVIDLSQNTKLEDDGFVGNNNPLEKVVLPNIPGRSFDSFVISELDYYEGYSSTLPEWYTTSDYQPGTGFVPSLTSDQLFIPFDGQTLYAKRTPNEYTIRFDSSGGTGTMDPVARTWDDGATALPDNMFNRLGYRFAGWSKQPGGSADYENAQAVENIGGAKDTGVTVTLYAVWESIEQSSGYFRSQMSPTQQTLYDDLVSQLPELTNPDDPSSVEIFVPDGAERSLERILFAALRDHPEFFWVDYANLCWKDLGNSRYALDLKVANASCFVEGFDADNLESYRTRFDEKVSQIVGAAPKDPVLAARYFNSWLVQHNTYNPNGLGASNFSRTAASGILSDNDSSQGPVCYGYASAMKVLLDRAGIENAYIEGWAQNGKNGLGEQHAWNYVAIDGSWYAIDPTWNDSPSGSTVGQEVYFLVGSSTITAPNLEGKESFGSNHDPSRSPAITLGFGYPTLSSSACPSVSSEKIEVSGKDGSAYYATIDEALAAALPGETVRLWSDAQLSSMAEAADGITLDLNGNKLKCLNGSSIAIASGQALKVANSAETQSEITSDSGSVFDNQGVLEIDPFVKVKSTLYGSPAVRGNSPIGGFRTYLASPSSSMYAAYRVLEPIQPDSGKADLADIPSGPDEATTVADLASYVNGTGKPLCTFKFLISEGNEASIPNQPHLEWQLVSGPTADNHPAETSVPLTKGVYEFKATAYDYELSYRIEITDVVLDGYISEGLSTIENMVGGLAQQAERGEVTDYDAECARKTLEGAKDEIEQAITMEDAAAKLEALRKTIEETPLVADRALNLEEAWGAVHGQTLSFAVEGAVTLQNAHEIRGAAQSALQDAQADRLIALATFPEEMSLEDKMLIGQKAEDILAERGGTLDQLETLYEASAWSCDAAQTLDSLPDPVTKADAPALQSLIDSYRSLDEGVALLVSPETASIISDLLDAALRDENASENPGQSEGEEDGGSGNEGAGEHDGDVKPLDPAKPEGDTKPETNGSEAEKPESTQAMPIANPIDIRANEENSETTAQSNSIEAASGVRSSQTAEISELSSAEESNETNDALRNSAILATVAVGIIAAAFGLAIVIRRKFMR